MTDFITIEIYSEEINFYKPSSLLDIQIIIYQSVIWGNIQAIISRELEEVERRVIDNAFSDYLNFFHNCIDEAISSTLDPSSPNFEYLIDYQVILIGNTESPLFDSAEYIDGIAIKESQHGLTVYINDELELENYLYRNILDSFSPYSLYVDFMETQDFKKLNLSQDKFIFSIAASLLTKILSNEPSSDANHSELTELIYYATKFTSEAELAKQVKEKISKRTKDAAKKRHAPQAKLKKWVQQKYLREKVNFKSANNWATVNTEDIQKYAKENNFRPSYNDNPALTYGKWCREAEK